MSANQNRLAQETSPYLLQHAHNPVDWYAWGDEAFAAARAQDKPIFLSVGYSTCYWCHVMERECFENETIAKLMNDTCINIKVDREERPDVDQLHMTAVQVMTQQGGWPMSVFLFPDGRPFYGGTYFPPRDAHGRPGFPTLLRAIGDAYRNRRDDVAASSNEVVGMLRQLAQPRGHAEPILIDEGWVDDLIVRSFSDYDARHGGFGGAPKFPRETLLELGLYFVRRRNAAEADRVADMLRHTLHAMADGGIRDQLGGGFHRYSTDAEWLVPHFEIMLYDNALLAWCYAEAAELLDEPRFAQIARRVCDFVLGEMTSPDGAFYTAIDAEVDAREGGSYLWTQRQVVDGLTEEPGKGMGAPFSLADAKRFLQVYGLDRGPNFADPHYDNGVARNNVLYLPGGAASENDPLIVRMRDFLYGVRRQRKQPLLDTKIITSWNALMIRGMVRVGQVLEEPRYVEAAALAMNALLTLHLPGDTSLSTVLGRAGKSVYRTSRDGVAKIDGFLDDESGLILALLDLADATDDDGWREKANERREVLRRQFGDDAGGYFFTAADAGGQLVRMKVAGDSPLPSGNGMAALVALRLGQADDAARTLAIFAAQLEPQAESMSTLLTAAMEYVRAHGPLTVPPRQTAASPTPADLAREAVTVHAEWASPTRIEVRLEIADGYHVNGPLVEPPLVATELRVHSGGNIERQFSPPTNGMLDDVGIYSGGVLLAVNFVRLPRENVKMTLIYQPCGATACLATVTHQIELVPPSGM